MINKKFIRAFSLVELMISLITVSLITAAFAPVITKKLSHGGITIGSFGGGSAEGKSCPERYYFENNECVICPAGFRCDGTNKIPCMAGTFAAQGQTQCAECPDGYYSTNGASECLENTAQNCAEKSKTENGCESCSADTVKTVDGKCVGSTPLYSYKNPSGADVTESETEVSSDDTYWYIKVKSSGTLVFQAIPTNFIDVFLVGGGAGGQISSNSQNCGGSVGGGGYSITEENVYVTSETSYPIVIGTQTSAAKCSITNGTTTSAFGLYAHGGAGATAHSVCPFNKTTCDTKYGQAGTNSNQTANSGNGGKSGSKGMSGVLIIRGKIGGGNNITNTLPSYKFMKSTGEDATTTYASLSANSTYWYLKLTSSGTLLFNSLPSSLVDVFLVGGGAGGQISSNSQDCGGSVGGGGYPITQKNMYVTSETMYPIAIGGSTGATKCSITTGTTTSGFGINAHGGVSTANHSICPFGEASCTIKYGNKGDLSNQNHNTGNGGASERTSLNGIIIIRGKTKNIDETNIEKLPVYTYTNSSGADISLTATTLNKTDIYWYLKFTASGNLEFTKLNSDKIDVFVVGSGAAGQTSSSSGNCGGADGGGGQHSISKDVSVTTGEKYPIVIGASSGAVKCSITAGKQSSAFGVTAAGGSGKTSRTVCLFNETDCSTTYGNTGSILNQSHNTGNGGASGRNSKSGVVIIRGKL